nr:hypothetical protein Itr_chr02CG15170 [Ipomoea trifida]
MGASTTLLLRLVILGSKVGLSRSGEFVMRWCSDHSYLLSLCLPLIYAIWVVTEAVGYPHILDDFEELVVVDDLHVVGTGVQDST